eukprot:scaffold26127_cov22-Tisochrysis_lutea.AAC.2
MPAASPDSSGWVLPDCHLSAPHCRHSNNFPVAPSGRDVYVDVAGWHLYLRDMNAAPGVKMSTALANQFGPQVCHAMHGCVLTRVRQMQCAGVSDAMQESHAMHTGVSDAIRRCNAGSARCNAGCVSRNAGCVSRNAGLCQAQC